jgi:hypothetical protein
MRIHKLVWVVTLLGILAVAAAAADITGKWKSEMATPDGQTRTTTYTFKVDGSTLTGTVAGARGGEAQIKDGKISGDDISFVVIRTFNDNEIKMQYTGKIAGDEIKLKVEIAGMDRTFEVTAKRM